jgi:ATP-dependent helicase/nuclease subunit B
MGAGVRHFTFYDITRLESLLTKGEWVITPNQRLRNRIRGAFAARHGRVGVTPPVYAVNEWLENCWQHLQDRGTKGCEKSLINDLQAHTLWKEVIDSSAGGALAASSRLIQQANEALRNLTLWQVPLDQLAAYGDADDYPLANWAGAFQHRLGTLGLITREAACERILQAFQSGALPRLPALHLESLSEPPPLLHKLIKAATADSIDSPPGPRTLPAQKADGSTTLRRVAAASGEEEIRAAALWAYQCLQRDAGCTIGIIVPDLGTRRDPVERIFTETFEPHYYSPEEARYTLPFNISTGVPLGRTPLVSATLQLLQLNSSDVERYQLRKLFNSPFWSDLPEEIGIRSTAIEVLERKGQFHYTPAQIRACVQRIAEQTGTETCQTFSRRLQNTASEWRRFASPASAGEWAERILQVLELLNWPGSRPLDSMEYQQANQWYQLLEKFTSLDLLQRPLNAAETLAILQQLANTTPFQAEVKQSPIQILGTLEGEGLQFDYCWVLGMTSQAWPTRPEPNPLLPLPLQRRLQMPRSTVEKEIAFASVLTGHYRSCAKTVVFSYPAQVDEAHMLPSSMIVTVPPVTLDDLLGSSSDLHSVGLRNLYREARASQTLEVVDCRYGPTFPGPFHAENDGEAVRGGTAILQQQALCPFNAFATLRLGATEPAEPSLGLTPAEKGSIIHAVLALIWRELQDQAGCKKNAPQLNALIERTTANVFADLAAGNRSPLGALYRQLEQDRVVQLLERLFEYELNRPPFKVVATEQELIREFAGLNFRLRIDRVDRIEDGQYVVIDYKTSIKASENQWLGERPDEPQLPLYALCYPQPVAGLAFACVRAQKPGYCGIVDESIQGWDKRIKTPQSLSKEQRREGWQALLAEFNTNLTQLAEEYRRGYAAVAPKNANNVTRQAAHLLPLNRLREADFLAFYLLKPPLPGAEPGPLPNPPLRRGGNAAPVEGENTPPPAKGEAGRGSGGLHP